MGRRLGDWLVYLVVRIFICVVQAVRIETCSRVAWSLAIVANDLVRLRQAVIAENLRQAFPQLSETQRRRLSRRMWHHLFLMVCEIAHVPRKLRRTNWRQYVTIDGESELVECLLDEGPTVIVSGHFGNFEVAGYICGLFGFPTYTIARPLDNPFLHDYVNAFRGATGQYILDKTGSSGDVQRVLSAGRTLALLGDQYAGPKGCWVPFFGRPASYHKAVAVFALGSQVPLLSVFATRVGQQPLKFRIALRGLADPQADGSLRGIQPMTKWYNDRMEEAIREAPEQYWWVHRRWK